MSAASVTEKDPDTFLVEDVKSPVERNVENGKEEEDAEEGKVLPKTWVVIFILSMGYGLSFWPVPILAAIGGGVSASLGDPNGYVWYIPSWSLAITVCFLITGTNTDLLGRRWFLVVGNLICFVGHVILATAKTSNTVTVGMAVAGFGAANCQMAAYSLSELIPNKWRHIGVVLADLATLIAVVVSPVTARYGLYVGNWRWNFYSAAIAQGLSFLGLLFLYFPPKHPTGIPYGQVFREMDYFGMFLFIAGAAPFLAGIVYTTLLDPSSKIPVTLLVVGAVVLVLFALWENIGERRGILKRPLTPRKVFMSSWGRDLTALCIACAVINMFYYSSSILYPTMIAVWWAPTANDWRYACMLSIVQGLGILTGVAILSYFGSKIRRWNWQLTGYCTFMVLFGSLMALATPDRKGMIMAFVFLCQAGYSAAMYLAIAISQMGVDQENLGLSGGLSGTARFAGGAIATAVFESVLTKTVNTWEAKLIPQLAVQAGLDPSQVPGLMATVGTAKLAENYNSTIVAAVGQGISKAYEHGFQMTAVTSVAFGVVGIIACALCKDIDPKMNDKIEVYMENTEYADKNKFH